MRIVINWMPPVAMKSNQEMQDYFVLHGIDITVSQFKKVPSGKLNTTFEGEPEDCNAVWGHIKGLEKERLVEKK